MSEWRSIITDPAGGQGGKNGLGTSTCSSKIVSQGPLRVLRHHGVDLQLAEAFGGQLGHKELEDLVVSFAAEVAQAGLEADVHRK